LACKQQEEVSMTEDKAKYEVRKRGLDSKTLSLLQYSGALKGVNVIADDSIIYALFALKSGDEVVAYTTSGKLKKWVTIDAAAKWLKTLGIGEAQISFLYWQPKQK